jgi:hypothetical protein
MRPARPLPHHQDFEVTSGRSFRLGSRNTRSGKYFKPGSRYYGKMKEGKFMTEIDALDSGIYSRAGTVGSLCEEIRS